MSKSNDEIDIRRPPGTELTLRCPACGMERIVPVNYVEIWRASEGVDPDWDGIVRCRGPWGAESHPWTEMVVEA